MRHQTAVILIALAGCIDARAPQPDAVDDASVDMHRAPDGDLPPNGGDASADASMSDDAAAADAAEVADGAVDAAPRDCSRFEYRGNVINCNIDVCGLNREDTLEFRLACCECDPERYCVDTCPPG